WMSRISGSVALLEMVRRYIPLLINRVLTPYLAPFGFSVDSTNVEYISDDDRVGALPARARSNSEELYFSPRMILLAVTLLNVVLFIGGTVYTGVQVTSIQKRYEDAAIKIDEAKQK